MHSITTNTLHTSKHKKTRLSCTHNTHYHIYYIPEQLDNKINKLVQATVTTINTSELAITKTQDHITAQLRTNKSPFFYHTYMNHLHNYVALTPF